MVETRAPGTEQIAKFLSFLTRTKRRMPGGRGGRPRALVAGEGWGGCRGDGSSKEGVGAWLAGSGNGWLGGRGRASVASFLTRTKRRKMVFFEGCPVRWGGYPPKLAWWTGG